MKRYLNLNFILFRLFVFLYSAVLFAIFSIGHTMFDIFHAIFGRRFVVLFRNRKR